MKNLILLIGIFLSLPIAAMDVAARISDRGRKSGRYPFPSGGLDRH